MLSTEQLSRVLQRDGYCVLEGVIPVDRCEVIRASVIETVRREYIHYEISRATNAATGTPTGRSTRRTRDIFRHPTPMS